MASFMLGVIEAQPLVGCQGEFNMDAFWTGLFIFLFLVVGYHEGQKDAHREDE